jgi:hypothetical protein
MCDIVRPGRAGSLLPKKSADAIVDLTRGTGCSGFAK